MELSDSEYDSDNLSTTSSVEGGAAKKKSKRPAFLEEEEDYLPSEDEEEELDEEREPDANDPDAENSDIDSTLSEEEEDNEDEDEINEEDIPLPQAISRSQKKKTKKRGKPSRQLDEEDDDNENEDLDYALDDNEMMEDKDEYYQKIKHHVERSRIFEDHPELRKINHEEMEALCQVIRDSKGRIIDPLHTTLPFLTKYEKADVLGKRAAQIHEGAPLFTEVDPSIIDGSLNALKEFEERKIPFIIQRPLPNGAMEYWRLQDLEVL